MTTRLTDPQYLALAAARRRGSDEILRFEDVSASTLISLAHKRYAILRTHKVGLRTIVDSATVTPFGWLTFREESECRVAAHEVKRVLAALSARSKKEVISRTES